MESDDVLIKRLLSRKSGPKLPHDLVFVFKPSTAEETVPTVEMTAEEVITSVNDERFSKVFDTDVNSENKRVQVLGVESQQFINLLRFIHKDELPSPFPGFIMKGKLELAHLHSTYSAAQHFDLSDVCNALLEYPDSKVSIDNSTILLDQYSKIAAVPEEKIDELIGIFGLHAHLAMHSKQFLQIGKSTLVQLLKSEKLFIQEKDLYYAVMRWINAELKRQGLEANVENKSKLFDEFKHLIRFPIMTKHQFFTAVAEDYDDEEDQTSGSAKSGLFSDSELEQFEKYFKSGDATLLPAGYSTERRTGLKVGVLKLVRNKAEKQYEYRMFTGHDDLPRPAERRDKGYALENYLDGDYGIGNDGDSYEYVLAYDYSQIKTPPIPAEARSNNLTCSENSIRVFRIDVTGSSSEWDYGCHLRIRESRSLLTTYYRRYTIDNTFGFYDYWPTVELKKGKTYKFEFLCPGENPQPAVNKVKLEKVYTKNKSGELVLDVQLRIVDGIAWSHPTYIFFLYQ